MVEQIVEQDLSGILVNSSDAKEFDIEYDGKKYHFKMRELPWVRVTQLMSRCFNYEGKKVVLDKSEFDVRYLEEALVEAPWKLDQTRMAVRRLKQDFGEKLSKYLPNIDADDNEELKKE